MTIAPPNRRRTAWLERTGWRVVRFWNNEILSNPSGVAQVIVQVLETDPRHRR